MACDRFGRRRKAPKHDDSQKTDIVVILVRSHDLQQGIFMMVAENAILVIDADDRRAADLKAMIEFLDSPNVILATPADWQQVAAKQTLHAIFVGNGLSAEQTEVICAEAGELCSNTPIVTVEQES